MGSRPQVAAWRAARGATVRARARRRARPRSAVWPVLAVIAGGGVVGALARYAVHLMLPHRSGQFPWSTFLVNVSGCLAIGILMVLIGEVWPGQRLLRPFLGVGVLGGYTTFSTYAIDIQQAVTAAAAATALLYLAATVLGALLAVWTGATITTRVVRRYRRVGMPEEGTP